MNSQKTTGVPDDLKAEGLELARELRSLNLLQDGRWKTMSELRTLLRQNPQRKEYFEQIIIRRIKLGTALSEYNVKLQKLNKDE